MRKSVRAACALLAVAASAAASGCASPKKTWYEFLEPGQAEGTGRVAAFDREVEVAPGTLFLQPVSGGPAMPVQIERVVRLDEAEALRRLEAQSPPNPR